MLSDPTQRCSVNRQNPQGNDGMEPPEPLNFLSGSVLEEGEIGETVAPQTPVQPCPLLRLQQRSEWPSPILPQRGGRAVLGGRPS